MSRLERVDDAFVQVANYLRKEIITGKLKPGDKLPGITILAKEFDINHQTAHRGIKILVDEGLVRTEHRKGSFVRDPSVWKRNNQ